MVWIDYVFLALMLIGLLYGIWRGIVMQIANIIGLIVASIMAGRFSGHMAELFGAMSKTMDERPWLANKIGYVIIFLVAFIFVKIIGHLLRKLVQDMKFGKADRIWGGAMGLGTAVVSCAAISMMLVPPDPNDLSESLKDSLLLPTFVRLACHTSLINSEEKIQRFRNLRAVFEDRSASSGGSPTGELIRKMKDLAEEHGVGGGDQSEE